MSGDTDAQVLVARAAELGVDVAVERAAPLLAYLDAMLDWNRHLNLTAVRDREQAVVLHVLDSLAAGLPALDPQHCLDLGSGNGFPGVGLTAVHPRASVLLLERTRKKVRAMDACLLSAGLGQVETLWLDAAQAPSRQPALRAAFDLVTARAVGPPERVAALAAPLLRPGGDLLLWLDADAEAPRRLDGFHRRQVLPYSLPEPAPRTRRLARWRRR